MAVEALKEAADQALRRRDTAEARRSFERALALAPRRLDLWMGLAASQRAGGDAEAALASVGGALAVEPRFFPALLMRGSLLEALGRDKEAATTYGAAVKLSPPEASLTEATRRALAHAVEVHDTYADGLAAELKTAAGLDGLSGGVGRKAHAFAEAVAGRRRMFHQEPVQFHYPGLPAIEFWERDEFPFLAALEAETAAIKAETLAVWSEGSPDLVPYVDYPPGAPVDQWAELNRSLQWSAFHLLRDGARVEANAAKCPATMAALALVDGPRVPGRSPSAMFSILRPHTHIPPHTGVSNTRLVLHLPLIVPDDCGFRVGGETRLWREGEAFVFDDTIEHEAWNGSDRPRAILICDVWNPRLSTEEREMIARLTAAFDRFNDVVGGQDL